MDALRMAAPYLSQFRGKAFVIKLGGEVMDEPAALRNVVDQIALFWNLGMRLVIVHGGGSAIDELSHKMGVRVKKVAGRRVTSDEAIDVVKMVLAGKSHVDLVAAMRRVGLPAVGLSGVSAGLLESEKRPPMEVEEEGKKQTLDFGRVGDVKRVNAELLTHTLDGGYLPVVAPLSASAEGEIYNTNADTAAAEIAIALAAEKLIFVLKVPGLLKDASQSSTVIPYLPAAKIDDVLKQGIASKGMLPKLSAAKLAIDQGVHSVHLVSGAKPDTLLTEVFTNEGSGTMIRKEERP